MKSNKQLYEKEEMIMELLWQEKEPLTSGEMFRHFEAKGWNEHNVYRAINSLLDKDLIRVCGQQLCRSLYARKFEPTITKEEYVVHVLCRIKQSAIAQIVTALVKADEKDGKDNAELIAKLQTIINEIPEE